jgi:hypothetical protein
VTAADASSFAAPLVISDAWIGPTGQAADIVEGEDVAVAGRDEQLAPVRALPRDERSCGR